MLFNQALFISWPVIVIALGLLFHRKQNSQKAWTGGAISLPKSLWLNNAIYSWFIYPVFLIPYCPLVLQPFLYLHIASWWARGIIELVMIYKWFNWSPRYGITHDLCQVIAYVVLLAWALLATPEINKEFVLVFGFGLYMVFATVFEAYFAFWFFQVRSSEEEKENIYFASDDPKWLFINRLTAGCVITSLLYAIAQAFFAVSFLS